MTETSNPKERSRRRAQEVRKKTGYRSASEVRVAEQLEAKGITGCYETARYSFTETRSYIPDFILPSGVLVEVKGMFDAKDRAKMLAVKAHHPELDIRFVFDNPDSKLNKHSKTTYGGWCEKHGFFYAKRVIPSEWLEAPCEK